MIVPDALKDSLLRSPVKEKKENQKKRGNKLILTERSVEISQMVREKMKREREVEQVQMKPEDKEAKVEEKKIKSENGYLDVLKRSVLLARSQSQSKE